MGFECGLDFVRKFEDITFDEYLIIKLYNDWRNNPWNFEGDHYPTFKKYYENQYLSSSYEGSFEDLGIDIHSNRFLRAADFYNNYKDTTACYTCSAGREFDHDILRLVDQEERSDESYVLTKDNIRDILKYFEKLEDEYDLCEVDIFKGFTVDDNDDITIKRIDGVEFELNDGSYVRSDSLVYAKDLWLYRPIIRFANTLDVLKNLSDDYFVWYWRSY